VQAAPGITLLRQNPLEHNSTHTYQTRLVVPTLSQNIPSYRALACLSPYVQHPAHCSCSLPARTAALRVDLLVLQRQLAHPHFNNEDGFIGRKKKCNYPIASLQVLAISRSPVEQLASDDSHWDVRHRFEME
jgi:hypothetical protein